MICLYASPYLYDASGNRVLKRSISGGSTKLTAYAFGLQELSYTGSGAFSSQTDYYAIAGHLIGSTNGTATTYDLTDAEGSVLTSLSSSAVLGEQIYGPYGNQRYTQGTMGTDKGYTGQFQDAVSGFDYYKARYYDPVMGQFLSADNVQGNVQGFDPYAYVAGNPETATDPTGHRFSCPPDCGTDSGGAPCTYGGVDCTGQPTAPGSGNPGSGGDKLNPPKGAGHGGCHKNCGGPGLTTTVHNSNKTSQGGSIGVSDTCTSACAARDAAIQGQKYFGDLSNLLLGVTVGLGALMAALAALAAVSTLAENPFITGAVAWLTLQVAVATGIIIGLQILVNNLANDYAGQIAESDGYWSDSSLVGRDLLQESVLGGVIGSYQSESIKDTINILGNSPPSQVITSVLGGVGALVAAGVLANTVTQQVPTEVATIQQQEDSATGFSFNY